MKTKLLYFAIDDPEYSGVIERLEAIAKDLGYTTAAGPGTGKGNIATLLTAIAKGELQVFSVAQHEQANQENHNG